MVDGTQSVGVLGACFQAGHEVIAQPGLRGADDGHSGSIDALADLDMVEVRLHLRAGRGLAIPVDGNNTKLGGEHRLARHGAWGHVVLDGDDDDARPFAELVRICRHSPDPDLDLRAAIKATKAKLRLIGRSGGMPRRTILMQLPLDSIIADFDCRIVCRLGHGGPHGRGQAMRIPVRPDVSVRLHDETLRRFRHAMVTVRRDGGAALTAGQCRAARDALDLLRLTHGSVIFDVVQCEAG